MDGNGDKSLPCTKMSPGLDGWRLEVQCSSIQSKLSHPYRNATGPQIVPSFEFEKICGRITASSVGRRRVEGLQQKSEKGNTGVVEDDESSTNNNMKAVRSFKFVLAEHIRELLKPDWKLGNLSRDAYKIIMKKSVHKIIESIETSKIPKTNCELHKYVSSSKKKIFELIQAYVKKYQKKASL